MAQSKQMQPAQGAGKRVSMSQLGLILPDWFRMWCDFFIANRQGQKMTNQSKRETDSVQYH